MKSDMPMDLETLLAEADWLRPLARSLARNSDLDEDDLIQDSLEIALRNRPTDKGKIRAWLRTVMLNVGRKQMRSSERRTQREQKVIASSHGPKSPSDDDLQNPERLVERAEHRQLIADAVIRLAEPYRRTVLWHYFEGWTPSEIAKHEQISATTVRVRLKRGLDSLRTLLQEKWGTQWRAHCLALAGSPTLAGPALISAKLWAIPAAAMILIGAFSLVNWDPPIQSSQQTETEAEAQPVHLNSLSQPNGMPAAALDPVRVEGKDKQVPAAEPTVEPTEPLLVRAVHAFTRKPIIGARVRLKDDKDNVFREPEFQPIDGLETLWRIPPSIPSAGITDENGEAKVNARKREGFVIVDMDGLLGDRLISEVLPPNIDEPSPLPRVIEVEVYPNLQVPVMVVNSKGTPASGIPLALHMSKSSESTNTKPLHREGKLYTTAWTNSDGLAVLQCNGRVWSRDAKAFEKDGRPIKVVVSERLAPENQIEIELDGFQPKTMDPVQFVIPERGKIRLSVSGLDLDLVATLSATEEPAHQSVERFEHNQWVEARPGTNGIIEFSGVPLNQSFTLKFGDFKTCRNGGFQKYAIIDGPTSGDRTKNLHFGMESMPSVRGRIRSPHGKIPFRYISAKFLDENNKATGAHTWATISENGDFCLYLNESFAQGLSSNGKVMLTKPASLLITGDPFHGTDQKRGLIWPGSILVPVPPDIFHTGADLGELRPGTAPRIAFGTVKSTDDTPVPGCQIWLDYEVKYAYEDAPEWKGVTPSIQCDAEGRFQFSMVWSRMNTTGRWRIRAQAPTGQYTQVEFEHNRDPMEVVFADTGSLNFSYRHNPALLATMSLRPNTGEGPPVSLGRLQTWPDTPRKLHQRTAHSIPEGSYEGWIYLRHGFTTVQSIPLGPVDIAAGSVSRPASYQDIDLMNLLQSVKYEIVDDLGSPIPGNSFIHAFKDNSDGFLREGREILPVIKNRSHLSHHLAAKLGITEETEFATISKRGYQAQRIRRPLLDQRIVMKRQPVLELAVVDLPELESGSYWSLEMKWLDGPPEFKVYPHREQHWGGKRKAIELPGYGRYMLKWFLHAPGGRTTLGVHEEITRFPSTSGSKEFDLVFPSQWDSP
jgi:RNA polymerase sigma factor (sigma-70 family)